jgi:LruC domain-containing protein
MNDLVIGYKFKIISYTQSHKVKNVYATFIVRANGAGLHNGFGFQLNVNPSSIISVTGVGDQTGYSINSNGTEFGNPTKATIILFDDSHKFMAEWNTVKGGPSCPWKTFNVHIKFSDVNTVTLQELSIQNWNPFIVVNGVRGHEVHLPNYTPTELVNPSFFRTGDDDTQIGVKYYKSKSNLPWALDIYGKFDYPEERADISNAYLHFQNWVISNGTQYQDWWLNTSSGYRNNNLIY